MPSLIGIVSPSVANRLWVDTRLDDKQLETPVLLAIIRILPSSYRRCPVERSTETRLSKLTNLRSVHVRTTALPEDSDVTGVDR